MDSRKLSVHGYLIIHIYTLKTIPMAGPNYENVMILFDSSSINFRIGKRQSGRSGVSRIS